jgi:hypothetical protein
MLGLLIPGVVLLIALVVGSVYLINRRSAGRRPMEDIQPNDASQQDELETLDHLHVHGHSSPTQHEMMQDAVTTNTSEEQEARKEAQ